MGWVRAIGLASLLLMAAGCSDDAGTKPESDADTEHGHERGENCSHDPVATATQGFWPEVEILEADWVEFQPTLFELAKASDAVVVGTLRSADCGVVLQGDEKEDVYTELLVDVEVDEWLHGTPERDALTFTLILPSAFSRDSQRESIARANAALPISNVVLLLRWRDDIQLFRLINGFGLWAETDRAPLDTPIEGHPPPIAEHVYADELHNLESVDALVAYLREL